MIQLQKYIPVWREVFKNATIEKQKMMLAYLIDEIVVYKDQVKIDFKLHINQFVNSLEMNNGSNEECMCQPHQILESILISDEAGTLLFIYSYRHSNRLSISCL